MFRQEKAHSPEFYLKAIEEWEKGNKLSRECLITPISSLTEEDLQIVVEVYNNPRSITTVQLIVDNLNTLKSYFAKKAKDVYMIASPIGNIAPTFGYRL